MKPYVICHMCTTIDGKILTKRWGAIPGPKTATQLFESTAASFGIGAWLVGTTTMREFAAREARLPSGGARVPHVDHVAEPEAKGLAIGADAKGVLRFREPDVDGDHVVLLVTERATSAYLAHLRAAGVSYLSCGRTHVDPKTALDKIRRVLGVRKLMLEGGGTFNGALLHAGLVDEISQVVVPIVDGGAGVSGFFDIPGPTPRRAAATLRLKKHTMLPGGVAWSRYAVTGKP